VKYLNFPRLARTVPALCVAALAAVTSVLVASPAHAATTGDHCMIVLPSTTIERCFATFDEARQYAEDAGAVGPSKTGPAVGPGGIPVAARSVAPMIGARTLIGVEIDAPPVTKLGSLWVYGTGGPCTTPTSNVDYEIPSYVGTGWDQRISSFLTFNNCWAKHYDLVSFGGASVGYQSSQSPIAALLNNDTSSERWS
jgi:hypothetical protein